MKVVPFEPLTHSPVVRLRTLPLNSLLLAATRNPSVSVMSPPYETLARYSLSSVCSRLTLPRSGPPTGSVMMLTAPAIDALPYSVLCGPLMISIRAASARSLNAMNCRPIGTSSTVTDTSDSTPMPIELVPMPRMLMPLFAGVVP